jgi:hypothetical protein
MHWQFTRFAHVKRLAREVREAVRDGVDARAERKCRIKANGADGGDMVL